MSSCNNSQSQCPSCPQVHWGQEGLSTCPHMHPQSHCPSCPQVHRGLPKGLTCPHTYPQSHSPSCPQVHKGQEGLSKGLHTLSILSTSPYQFRSHGPSNFAWRARYRLELGWRQGFLFQLQSSTFLIAFRILLQVLYVLRELTVKLQMQAIDVVYAYKMVNSVLSTLKALWQNSTAEFKKLFTDAIKLGKQLHRDDFLLSKPRLTGREAHRSNPTLSTAEDYYHVTLYDEFLSHVVAELEDKFSNNPSYRIPLGLLHLLPNECVNFEDGDSFPPELAEAVDFYRDDIPHTVMFPTKYSLWVRKWKSQQSSSMLPNS